MKVTIFYLLKSIINGVAISENCGIAGYFCLLLGKYFTINMIFYYCLKTLMQNRL